MRSCDCRSFAGVKQRAAGKWPDILFALGIDRKYLKKKHGPCPICGGKDRFRFDDRNNGGSFYCGGCGPGDAFTLLQRAKGMTAAESLKAVAQFLPDGCPRCLPGEPVIKKVSSTPVQIWQQRETEHNHKEREKALAIWDASRNLWFDDLVMTYLTKTRGIPLINPPDDIRIHPCLEYWKSSEGETPTLIGTFPAMVAAARNSRGNITGVHITYLTEDSRKLSDERTERKARKQRGTIKGAAVRLMPASHELMIAEGIETALAASILLGKPCWSVLSSTNIQNFRIPEGVKKLTLCVDSDDAGYKAAEKAMGKIQPVNRCKIQAVAWSGKGNDFNDALFEGVEQ